jgi:protein-disulfide isomerase
MHPGSPTTHVHLGRVYLRKKDYPDAKRAYLDALAADPFDEEIHVALAVIGDALHDTALANRARKAAALLTGVPADKVNQLGQALTEPDQGAGPPPVTQATGNAAELRKELAAKGPSRGPATAPVTIVEFSDFQCPSCRRAHDTIEQLLLAYPGKLRLVYRHFPLEMHEHAELAAEAAQCADEQGKFWPYHDALFQNQAHLSPKDLLGYARALSLDGARFAECVESGRQSRAVKDDLAAGEAAGVNATPTFFVNGAKVVGALELDEFKRIVDEQLGAN